MSGTDNPPSDDEMLASHAAVLARAVERALPGWVERCVAETARAWEPGSEMPLCDAARAAANQAAAEVGPQVRELLERDVDEQDTGPLAILRGAVRYPTKVLADAGVPPVARDDFARRAFPSDVYDLSPASFAAIDPALHEPGLVWGAAKAHVVLARRRADGSR